MNVKKKNEKKRNQTRQSTTIEMETRQMILGDDKKNMCTHAQTYTDFRFRNRIDCVVVHF